MPRRRGKRGSALRRLIEARARKRCEYCQAPQRACGYRFHLEHVRPSSRGGSDAAENRALACAPCNLAKVDRVSAIDPQTGVRVPLFNPRSQAWEEHFRWGGGHVTIIGRTPIGRATVAALDMNSSIRRQSRRWWFSAGWLPG